LGLIGVDFDEAKASLIVPFDKFADLPLGRQEFTSTVM
jgi:hypothetical protein